MRIAADIFRILTGRRALPGTPTEASGLAGQIFFDTFYYARRTRAKDNLRSFPRRGRARAIK